MMKDTNKTPEKREVIIIPHSHWDREWYLPFQEFRYKLVALIDTLLEIFERQDYRFMLDGQTIVLEDYLEIKPGNRERLTRVIRDGKLSVGPWYLLPDEWLVSGESLIRNLEYSHVLSTRLGVPLVPVGYLPDQFGHTRAIPQLLGDLTDFIAAVVWRGVGNDVNQVCFRWKSHESSTSSILGVYLKGSYGNAASFPETESGFFDRVDELIKDLEGFLPVPVYLMMNGSDHLFPQPFLQGFIENNRSSTLDISLGFLSDYINILNERLLARGISLPERSGEFRSSARSPLLQDTYSARMWIKIWNQEVDDLLVRAAEPLSSYAWLCAGVSYPSGFLETAWKWHMKNQPHDSICGCSIDQTHDEMRVRYSWAESIATSVIRGSINKLRSGGIPSDSTMIVVFNPTSSEIPQFTQVILPEDVIARGFMTDDGKIYPVQKLQSRDDVVFQVKVGATTAKMGLKLLPGRKIMDFYINDIDARVGEDPEVLEIIVYVDSVPVGDLKIDKIKKLAREILGDRLDGLNLDFDEGMSEGDLTRAFKKIATRLINSRRFKKFHLVATKPAKNKVCTVLPLSPAGFTGIIPTGEPCRDLPDDWLVQKNGVENRYYAMHFNKDGTVSLHDKSSGLHYDHLHVFEDWGDRGDEYTFGRLGPERVRVTKVKRMVLVNGPVFAEIRQKCILGLFGGINGDRKKRVGKSVVEVESTFRFYRDLPRIDVTTTLINTAKDHRLRICFDMPFTATHTRTATHFGCVERAGDPEQIDEWAEQPSGIQAQKRYIRVDQPGGAGGFTVTNKGLPEAELVNGRRIAVTLVRSIGWLSRSDFPERPLHAGPAKETPGAQEVGVEYTFKYGFLAHSSEEPIYFSEDHGDASSVETVSIPFIQAEPPAGLMEPVIRVDSPWIRISSLRVRDGSLLVTMYNLADERVDVRPDYSIRVTSAKSVLINGDVKDELNTKGGAVLTFNPHEIKMIALGVG
ncbi:MAG: glycoside hydrolase family 38 C-terminal domain-containing protein [Promethearchaeota archaeon]